MTEGTNFNITLNKSYTMGCDPFEEGSESYSVGVISSPKRIYKLKKIRGFKRVAQEGFEYVIEILKNEANT